MKSLIIRDVSYSIYVRTSLSEDKLERLLNSNFPNWNTWGLLSSLGFDHALLVRIRVFDLTNEEFVLDNLKDDLRKIQAFNANVKNYMELNIEIEMRLSRCRRKSMADYAVNSWRLDMDVLSMIREMNVELIFTNKNK